MKMRRIVLLAVIIVVSWVDNRTIQSQSYESCSTLYPARNADWSLTEDLLAVGYGSSIYVYDVYLNLRYYHAGDPVMESHEAWWYEPIAVLWRPESAQILYLSGTSFGFLWDPIRNVYNYNVGGIDPSDLRSADWHPTGRYYTWATLGRNVAETIRADSFTFVSSIDGQKGAVWSVSWHPGGHVLAIGEGHGILSFWNPFSRTHLKSVVLGESNIKVIEWSPDGKSIAIGMSDGTAGIWNYTQNDWQGLLEPTDESFVTGLAWDDDSSRLAVALSNGEVNIFDVERAEVVKKITIESSNTVSLAWKNSMLAIFSCAGVVQIWDTDSYEMIGQVELNQQ